MYSSTPVILRRQKDHPCEHKAWATDLSVSKVMTPMPYTIASEAWVTDAQEILNEHKIHHLPVLEKGNLVGILNSKTVTAAVHSLSNGNIVVAEIMNPLPLTFSEETPLQKVLSAMVEEEQDSVLIVHPKSGNAIGVLTWRDVVRLFTRLVFSNA